MSKRLRDTAALALVVAAAAFLLGYRLDAHPLWDPDEAKHAEVAREMLAEGRLLEPLINFEPYHHKPSLLYALIGVAYRVFGVGELGARIVPALSAIATLLAVFRYGRRRSLAEGLLACLLLASCGFFVAVGRYTNFDATLTCVSTVGVLLLADAVDRVGSARSVYLLYAAVGLAVLVKGPAAFVLIAVPAAFALWRGDLSIRQLELRRGLVILACVIGAWLVPALLVAPDYVADFFWTHNVQRYLAPVGADVFHPEPIWFFLPVLAATLLPWSPLLVHALPEALMQRGSQRLLSEYALWVVVFFSLSSGKLATYVLPAYPALALVTAAWLKSLREHDPSAGTTALRFGAAACALLAPIAWIALHRLAPEDQALALLVTPATLGGVIALLRTRGGTLEPTLWASAGMLATVGLLVTIGAAAAGRWVSDYDLAQAALAQPKTQRVIAYRVRPFSFLFYTRMPLQYRVPVAEVRDALYAPGEALLLTEDRWGWHLEEIAPGIELAEIARNSRHVLYRVRSPWGREP